MQNTYDTSHMYVDKRTVPSQKKLLFAKAAKKYFRDPWLQIAGILGVSVEQAKKETQNKHQGRMQRKS